MGATRTDAGIVGIQYREIAFGLLFKDARLRSGVGLHGLVPVEMIRSQIQEHGNVRMKCFDQLELKTAELDNSGGAFAGQRHARNQRRANVAGDHGGKTGHLQNVMNQRSSGGFSVGAGDADQAAVQKAVGELNLAPHGNALRACLLQQRSVGGNAGAGNDQVLLQQTAFRLAAQLKLHAFLAQAENVGPEFAFRVRVDGAHDGAVVGAKARGGDAGARQSNDQHVFSPKFESARHARLKAPSFPE